MVRERCRVGVRVVDRKSGNRERDWKSDYRERGRETLSYRGSENERGRVEMMGEE